MQTNINSDSPDSDSLGQRERDTNDADYLRIGPAMRRVVGGRAERKLGASTSEVGRFKTESLPTEENLEALSSVCGGWVDAVHRRTGLNQLVLDMDNSESPTYTWEGCSLGWDSS